MKTYSQFLESIISELNESNNPYDDPNSHESKAALKVPALNPNSPSNKSIQQYNHKIGYDHPDYRAHMRDRAEREKRTKVAAIAPKKKLNTTKALPDGFSGFDEGERTNPGDKSKWHLQGDATSTSTQKYYTPDECPDCDLAQRKAGNFNGTVMCPKCKKEMSAIINKVGNK